MKIKEVTQHLERRFPLYLQEDFDNCGVQCGDIEQEITGALICFEMSEAVLDEAVQKGFNLVISHHPLILKRGIRRISPTDRVGKILYKALVNNLVLYSMHTNIDSAEGGGNDAFAELLGLQNTQVLVPHSGLYGKVVVFVPTTHTQQVKDALAATGCGVQGNYDHCSYTMTGTGHFRPNDQAHPFIGETAVEEDVAEDRVEMIFPIHLQRKVIQAIYKSHPYEEPAFDIIRLENPSKTIGLGRIGMLPKEMDAHDFLEYIKEKMQVSTLRYYGAMDKKIKNVAVCGGGGASFIGAAMAAGADAYVSGDIKYHDFLDTDKQMLLADIGHREGEHFIKEIIYKEVKENFTTFATEISKMDILEILYI
ncbi:MAG: Nif3-like dinuclear metal center hexameric protein [Bacteroidales bacterium]|nr:Nif3-like dinuclear metal center hexameric protein [Bacteroidales bacterium]